MCDGAKLASIASGRPYGARGCEVVIFGSFKTIYSNQYETKMNVRVMGLVCIQELQQLQKLGTGTGCARLCSDDRGAPRTHPPTQHAEINVCVFTVEKNVLSSGTPS
jgi:hypothetical protein